LFGRRHPFGRSTSEHVGDEAQVKAAAPLAYVIFPASTEVIKQSGRAVKLWTRLFSIPSNKVTSIFHLRRGSLLRFYAAQA
jgi:hypothetical protein